MSGWEVVRVLLHDFREQIGELLVVQYDLYVFSYLLIIICRVLRWSIHILSVGLGRTPIETEVVGLPNERI